MAVIRRDLAFILDFVFLSLFFFPITYLYSGRWVMTYEDHLWGIFDPICAVFLFIIIAYFILLEAYAGRTIGKKVLGFKVVGIDGKRIGILKSLIRNVLRLVDGLPAFNILGIILISTSPKNQRLGDYVAKTFVIREKG
jgi:uncharacterized RDD family membrane protein YckC